jgi:hypothetical protein
LYVDSSLSYLMIILLNDFIHPKNLSTADLILPYSSTLYGLGSSCRMVCRRRFLRSYPLIMRAHS